MKTKVKNTLTHVQTICLAAALYSLHAELQLFIALYKYHSHRYYRYHDTADLYNSYRSRIKVLEKLASDVCNVWLHFSTLDAPSMRPDPQPRMTGRLYVLLDELDLVRIKIIELFLQHGRLGNFREPLSDGAWHDLKVALFSLPAMLKQSTSIKP
jgi:hypothetical protein